MNHLLFIAMSGVRVHNAALRELGLTLPGFVERGQVIASLPSLSLLTLAAHTPPTWSVEYLEVDELNDAVFERISSGCFRLVAISSLSARIFDAYRLADRLREEGVTVIMGGLHVSALPNEARLHADCVVQGEGENLWPRLLADFEANRLQPFYTSLAGENAFHLKYSKVPRWDLLELSKYNRLTLQTTRGCPLDCSFCAASRTISSYKLKPIPLVRAELEALLSIWPRPFIELADDNTFVSKSWANELISLFSEFNLRWFTETDISIADDEHLLEKLAQSGCAQLLIGLESTDAQALYQVDRRNWKYERAKDYLASIKKIQSYGIAVNGCFVLGFDQDTAATFESVRLFVEESELCDTQITVLTPFPGTRLYAEMKQDHRLFKEVFWDECTLFDLTFRPRQLSPEAFIEHFAQLMATLYSEKARKVRQARLRRCLKISSSKVSKEL